MELTSVELWLWIGFAGMGLGSLIILLLSKKLRKRDNYHALIALLVTSIATISYYALARGQADIMVGNDVVYFGRYLDWLFTTPLLLLSLLVIALPVVTDLQEKRERVKLIATVLVANVLMIVTGLFADLSTNSFDSTVWYVASCLWFLVVLGVMFTEVKKFAFAHSKESAKVYMKLLAYLTFLWVLYPVVWVLGTTGIGTFDLTTETAMYAILDVSAKAVFGILVVVSILKLEKVAKPSKRETTVESA
jgi:bacteriorhodopsin